jgi:hypothetical protein
VAQVSEVWLRQIMPLFPSRGKFSRQVPEPIEPANSCGVTVGQL